MKRAIFFFSLLLIAVFAWTFTAFLVTPFFENRRKPAWIEVAGYRELAEEYPTKLSFQYIEQESFIRRNQLQEVWVIKHSVEKATVFSPVCPHLGCRYNWDELLREFVCPCHASIFTITGAVVSGPAPRPLDTLPYEIKEGNLHIQWEEFKPGLVEKVSI
ncbi:MAG: ubiquinol-cytochrome c reductase iron-sulfur subunit [Verrucomicrobiota bacterium]|nr:ubiquinol-cytochrome c reductase iron-sulfur subunit [Verrucomicrobiota bacterium]